MSKKGGNNQEAKDAQMRELARQQQIRAGTAEIDKLFNGQFTDGFFNDRRQSAMDYYTPQLDNQYQDARRQLIYGLARSGGTDSSAAASQEADLQRKFDMNRQAVADKALSIETGARNNIEDSRSQLLQMLNATGDVQGAINAASTRMKMLSTPDSYSPLTDLFSTGMSALSQTMAAQRANELANSFGLSGPQANPLAIKNAVSNT